MKHEDQSQSSSHSPVFFTTCEEAIAWIVGLKLHGIKPGLARMHHFMEVLDFPHRKLRFIHVAGTNGKGSTCAFLSHTLLECGYDVGSFTSPYIEKYTERIQYNGQQIDELSLVALCNVLKPIVDEIASTELGSPTMFEVSTVLAILYFSKIVHPDYVVWETGLGGRLDSTNIVHPVVTIITNVGYDHMEILGDSLTDIAREKAGILKSGVPLITAIQSPEARMIVEQIAKDKQVTVYALGEQFDVQVHSTSMNQQTFDFQSPFRKMATVSIRLNGQHQIQNAAVALMTLEVLRQYHACIFDDEDIERGMRLTSWPGRLEMISHVRPILIDGAHNPQGAEVLAHSLQTIYPHRYLYLMIGMLSTKSHKDYLKHLLPLAHTLLITEPDFTKKANASYLAELAKEVIHENKLNVQLIVEPDWHIALQHLVEIKSHEDLTVVTGSLYLVSDVRAWLINQTAPEKGW